MSYVQLSVEAKQGSSDVFMSCNCAQLWLSPLTAAIAFRGQCFTRDSSVVHWTATGWEEQCHKQNLGQRQSKGLLTSSAADGRAAGARMPAAAALSQISSALHGSPGTAPDCHNDLSTCTQKDCLHTCLQVLHSTSHIQGPCGMPAAVKGYIYSCVTCL